LCPGINNLIVDLKLPYPMFQGLSLESLLSSPISKKKVFQVLSSLKELVTQGKRVSPKLIT
jgi:hypothetical protein